MQKHPPHTLDLTQLRLNLFENLFVAVPLTIFGTDDMFASEQPAGFHSIVYRTIKQSVMIGCNGSRSTVRYGAINRNNGLPGKLLLNLMLLYH
uniref:AraC family transcriptional regulator n=1 Tax=Angiostrongylus cantonensis TaxID=6313 RepID=A0A0K0DPI5_ANGCA